MKPLLFIGAFVILCAANVQLRASDSEQCINVFRQEDIGKNLSTATFNVNSGRALYVNIPIAPPYAWYSPDRQYIAFFQAISRDEAGLFISPVDGQPILIKKTRMGAMLRSKFYTYIVWSSDSRKLAYFDNSEPNLAVTTASADGSRTMTKLLNKSPNDLEGPFVYGWSMDNAYLAFSEWSSSQLQLIVLSGMDLSTVSSNMIIARIDSTRLPLDAVAWSPQGHRLATLIRTNNHSLAIVWSPDKGIITQVSFEDHDTPLEPRRVNWSPNGDYFAFEGGADVTVIRPDGTALSEMGDYLGWSTNEQIAELRQINDDRGGYLELVSLNVKSSQVSLLQSHIVLGSGTFTAVSPDSKRIAFLAEEENKYVIASMDLDGKNRLKFYEEVKQANNTPEALSGGNLVWSANSKGLLVLWIASAPRFRTIYGYSDRPSTHIVSGLAKWLNDTALIYPVYEPDSNDVHLVNLDASQMLHFSQPPDLISIAPDNRIGAVEYGDDDLELAPFSNKATTKVLLTGHLQHKFPDDLYGYRQADDPSWAADTLVWSPDSSMLAFIYTNSLSHSILKVVGRDGAVIQEISLSDKVSDSFIGFIAWTPCSRYYLRI